MAGKRAVFLDRDDTLMEDVVYCRNPDDVRLLPGAAQCLKVLADAGFLIVIATNQSGIGRGYFTESDLEAVHERLRSQLRNEGADFHAIYYCPHRPDDGCDCRKPKPGLILRAASDLGIDLGASYSIGDREWDVEAGRAAGTRTILVTNGHARGDAMSRADHVATGLEDASRFILSSRKDRGATA